MLHNCCLKKLKKFNCTAARKKELMIPHLKKMREIFVGPLFCLVF